MFSSRVNSALGLRLNRAMTSAHFCFMKMMLLDDCEFNLPAGLLANLTAHSLSLLKILLRRLLHATNCYAYSKLDFGYLGISLRFSDQR